jgi:glycine dehydrogenase subunit 2
MGGDDLKKASQLAVLNANYIKESLRDVFHLPYDRPCMHECVFTDQKQADRKIMTLDIEPPHGLRFSSTIYSLWWSMALMIEPTETESGRTRSLHWALKAIAEEADKDPRSA